MTQRQKATIAIAIVIAIVLIGILIVYCEANRMTCERAQDILYWNSARYEYDIAAKDAATKFVADNYPFCTVP